MAVNSPKDDGISGTTDVLSENLQERLFPAHLELVPQLNELYELELAFLESQILGDGELIRNGAYFARVGDVLTRHFLMCSGEPVRLPRHSSSRLRSFFEANQFKTGYGTHGLFPYRGKFHPQMVKGILNVMGLKPRETVLDPMMGSGTVLIEARLMGINSFGVDASPFCRFMARAKLAGLTISLAPVRAALRECRTVFDHFTSIAGGAGPSRPGARGAAPGNLFDTIGAHSGDDEVRSKASLPDGCEDDEVYDFLLLAYLDSAGYAERSQRKAPYEQFRAILERYLFVAEKIQRVLAGIESELGSARAMEGDARQLPLEDSSVDGILFSPPYSFAIDYLANDAFHLQFMGVDKHELQGRMIGLRGTTLRRKFDAYRDDMDAVLRECARVVRPGCICSIVVGTNNNQLSKILSVPPSEVQGIDELLLELASQHGLHLARRMSRQITGMANTMRSEFILMLRRV